MLDIQNIAIRGGRGKEGQWVNCDYLPLMGKTNHTEKGGGDNMHGMDRALSE